MTEWRHLTIPNRLNLLKIWQSREDEPSTVLRVFRRIIRPLAGWADLFAPSNVELRVGSVADLASKKDVLGCNQPCLGADYGGPQMKEAIN
jgi:hypothetical protein